MSRTKTEDHIALFIDCDNISHSSIEGVINELSKYGVVNIRQAYGNWTKDNLKNWEDKLLEFHSAIDEEYVVKVTLSIISKKYIQKEIGIKHAIRCTERLLIHTGFSLEDEYYGY